MGKKRNVVTNSGIIDGDDEDKPPNHVPIDNHHHRNNLQKRKKIKPEAKLLHTLNSHLKKLAKYRSRNLISLSSPPSAPPTNINKKDHRGQIPSWLKRDHPYDQLMDFDFDTRYEYGGDMWSFEYRQELLLKTTSFLGSSEDDEDLFGGGFVFAPDLNASHIMVVVFGEYGLGYGSYIPDPVLNLDHGDEGRHIYDMMKLSSQEDMINEFLKVNLFVS